MLPVPCLDRTPRPNTGQRRVVIIGGGFGGLACARALAGADVHVTLVDRRNHHLFQPLLYQVSTAALSPADIAAPIRHVLAEARNVDVVLAEVSGIDKARRQVQLTDGGYIPFDQLVIATGSAYNYFAHSEWAAHATAPKTITDARTIRARLLRAFEEAESCAEPMRRAALLTVVIVGGGPTGVEMAGTVAELARYTLRGDFRRIDPTQARVILVEAGPKLLGAFPPTLSAYAERALQRLGVEVRLNTTVQQIDAEGAQLGDQRIEAANVIWGAGVRAAAGADWLGGTDDRAGRLPVDASMAVAGQEGIYALGDVSLFTQDGKPLPLWPRWPSNREGTWAEHYARLERRNRFATRPKAIRPSLGDTRRSTRSVASTSRGGSHGCCGPSSTCTCSLAFRDARSSWCSGSGATSLSSVAHV